MKKQRIGEFELEIDDKEGIKAVSLMSSLFGFPIKRVIVGQKVRSNGKRLPAGLEGNVIAIREPYKEGRLTDIILVSFKNEGVDEETSWMMKFEELESPRQYHLA